MSIAALIIGIDGWGQYTAPLVESIRRHEPDCQLVVIDNASAEPYPEMTFVQRTERLCYSAAINHAHQLAGQADWYIVLSNDVLCQGPFSHMLAALPANCIAGPCLKETHGFQYLEGWCVCIPAPVWNALGGWDEGFLVSSWEDVSFSQSAMEHGFDVIHAPDLPFTHLDQRQRFTLSANYWDSERHNIAYFMEKRKAASDPFGNQWRAYVDSQQGGATGVFSGQRKAAQ